MTVIEDSQTVAEARRAYERFQDEQLAASVLAAMPVWMAAGAAPAAGALRQAGFRSDGDDALKLVRLAFARSWGFAIPCAEMVEALRPLSPLVELGAGTGYLTALLNTCGLDVLATDVLETGAAGFRYVPGSHAPLVTVSGPDAVLRYPERNVLCSWPTEGRSWALEAALNIAAGRSFCLIAEPTGGKTATPEFYGFLAGAFDLVAEVQIPQFVGCHDFLAVYRRR